MTRRYIVPAIGRVPLAELTPQHVARSSRRLAPTSLSPTSQRYVYAVLRIALGRAVKLGRAHRNVATRLSRRESQRRRCARSRAPKSPAYLRP